MIIAGARVKAAMLSPGPHDPLDSPRDKYDFEVLLTTLRGGYAGTTQEQRLYFNYPGSRDDSSSYRDFLARLQEATQLSIIPPLEPGEPYRTSSGFMDDTSALHGFDDDTGTPANALGIMLHTPPDSFTTAPAPINPRRDVKGYTVNDGPWIYTSVLNGQKSMIGKLGPEEHKKLSDKDSYDNMILVLEKQVGYMKNEKGVTQTVKALPKALVVHITHVRDAVGPMSKRY